MKAAGRCQSASLSLWGVAGGSVVGREHVRLGRNNQDAWGIASFGDLTVAAVADGCSSGAHSEVGAWLAVRWLLAQVPALWRAAGERVDSELAERACDGLLDGWQTVLEPLAACESAATVVGELFLSTLLVAVADREAVLVFGVGDGLVLVDDGAIELAAGADNAPPYLAYRLLPEALVRGGTAAAAPRVHLEAAAGSLRRIVLATDGCVPLLADGRLADLLGERRIFTNRSLVQKRLRQASQETGLLTDDATLVVLERSGEELRCKS